MLRFCADADWYLILLPRFSLIIFTAAAAITLLPRRFSPLVSCCYAYATPRCFDAAYADMLFLLLAMAAMLLTLLRCHSAAIAMLIRHDKRCAYMIMRHVAIIAVTPPVTPCRYAPC